MLIYSFYIDFNFIFYFFNFKQDINIRLLLSKICNFQLFKNILLKLFVTFRGSSSIDRNLLPRFFSVNWGISVYFLSVKRDKIQVNWRKWGENNSGPQLNQLPCYNSITRRVSYLFCYCFTIRKQFQVNMFALLDDMIWLIYLKVFKFWYWFRDDFVCNETVSAVYNILVLVYDKNMIYKYC